LDLNEIFVEIEENEPMNGKLSTSQEEKSWNWHDFSSTNFLSAASGNMFTGGFTAAMFGLLFVVLL
jgi:hypothetical protein